MILLYGFALLAGFAAAIAPGQNASLSKSLARTRLAGTVSIAVSLVTVLAVLPATGQTHWPTWQEAMQVPWWAWFGGVFSAFLAVAQLTVSKRIGAAPFLGLIVTAGIVTSILLDHYGLVGFKTHAADLWRVAGGGLMILGVTLIALF